ncbi:MAG: hypothetical protein OEY52_10325 [Gammaproteobacteria bacterium]|nr:hypothetical protein [Gammaproteobacteria bacterium]
MCIWLKVSRSGYYKSRRREVSPRERKRELVRSAVVDVYFLKVTEGLNNEQLL